MRYGCPLAKAKHYRDQAENLRSLAALDDNVETRESLLAVARTYDRLSEKFLERANAKGASTTPDR